MKVFISWSKSLSKECAEILRDWIKCTLQASEPWVSSKDIDKGSLWFNEINDQLKDTKVGIVCLTKENKENPWILFESGALAKGLSANRVCTFLIDLTPAALANPMAQFNHTMPDKEGMKSLLVTINKELGTEGLEDRILDQVFETYWPLFDNKFKAAMKNVPSTGEAEPVRSSDDILTEILYTTRTMDKRIRSLERQEDKFHIERDFSKSEIVKRIQMLSKKGLHPKEIAMELDGIAPMEFIMEIAINYLEENGMRMNTIENSPNKVFKRN
ncbi:toll/interleukin-1 receptor domain-containing protein [Shewanella sp. SR43-4]|uniref:TIR domain-containing protein n=1 Tax=Shewanella sp. SR43-4 TaxID=2760942 RepID=UPI0015FAAE41|nr:TIR domain-containing protein [Shewanella sp. SR43-4]MBB1319371.1 toll/interleukin-1 receptor domain-containing protein [Shewanella sp. SR43-4]|tara:strand:+ start:104 stop:919 length:816 start_codon:yes stop_codon:yes gene_type:complete